MRIVIQEVQQDVFDLEYDNGFVVTLDEADIYFLHRLLAQVIDTHGYSADD